METIDNIIIHHYPASPWIVKCGVNLRDGKRIVWRDATADPEAALGWIARHYNNEIKVKIITHK